MKTADYAHIPSDLKASAEWFLFKQSNGKPQLFSYRGKAIDTVNPRASGTFKEVCAEGQRAQYDGLATVVKGGDIKYFHTEASTPAPTVPGAEPKAATPKAQHAPASVSATSPTADAQRAVMVSGFGQLHTNEPDPDKPNKKLTPYQHITFDGIRALVDNPQQFDKAKAQWLIPSSLQSREFKRQEVEGQFWMLWADFDTDPQSVERVAQAVDLVTGGSDYEVYNSRGATVNRPKSRALIVLANPLSGGDWVVCQQVLNDKLEAQGLSTDRASERAAQLCYLPNRGAHYESRSQRDGVLFDPLAHWADEIRAKRKAIAEADAELRARKEDAQTRKAAIASAPGTQGRSLIDAFNECFTVQDILLRNGYVQRGDAFRHPGSESGSYSAGVKNGRVNALSPNDPLFTDCKGAHDAFSAFKMLEHGGDHDAALKDAGDNWLVIGGEPWNKVRRREYAQEKAAAELAKVDLSGILRQGEGKSDSPSAGEIPPAPRQVDTACAAIPEVWPEPVDPFVEHAAPQFPVDHLPKAMADYCHELSAQSGFDAGGYGFAMLVAASNLIDHRARLSIGPLNVPAFLWGGLVASAGAGKSPIMSAAMKFAHRVNDDLVRASLQKREAFIKECTGMTPKEIALLDQPPWKQLIASDTTIEALGVLLKDNPTGLLLAYDELSEFVGRMDAYNGGTGKDRGTYLQAFDGGSKTINRKSSIVPLVVENFSVGVLAGVQPEKLAEMFKKSGGADGLFQRFIVYALPRPGDVNYVASLGTFTETNCGQVFERLYEWSRNGLIAKLTVDAAVLPLMENYHRHVRIIAQRTPSSRLAEHYDKFPGFLARILFALHCMECAARGRFSAVVTAETFNRAHAIAHVLYRHSEAVYEALGQEGAGSSKLMKAACEAILTKGWTQFKWGDLTRNATGWQEADDRQAHGAIDLLIEFDWLREVMPERVPGRPGRRSVGVFEVNGLVHKRFVEQSQRIVRERAARYAAIQEVAAIRRERPWE